MRRLSTYDISDYNLIRDEIETGDILLCSGQGLFSTLIQKFTSSEWSHVGIIIKLETFDRVMIAESMEGKGFRLVPISWFLMNYSGKAAILRHPEFKEKVDLKQFGKLIFDLQATEYDNREIARNGKRTICDKLGITKLFNLKFKPVINTKLICSEAIKQILDSFDMVLPFNKQGTITPADFGKWSKLIFKWRIK